MDKIAVVDNGGQYTHLIASKIRKFNVFSEIVPPDLPLDKFKEFKGIILSGSPFSVHDKEAPRVDKKVYSLDIPVLGICYGLQLITHDLGGIVKKSEKREYGKALLRKEKDSDILSGLEGEEQVWMSHGDSVIKAPESFEIIASTKNCEVAAIQDKEKKIYGFQFHPEVRDTLKGELILKNFVLNICKAKQEWNMKNFLEEEIREIREKAGDKEVLVLASGGVDSTVLVYLLSKAVQKQKLHVIHIDNGFMRKGESERVVSMFKSLGVDVKFVDASHEFIEAIGKEVDPERKRKIVGEKFVEIVNREASNLKLQDWLLAQGTIYPDTIESGGSKRSDVIKTHHNRVGLIQEMIKEGKIIEPLKELYKAEVRELGRELGVPDEIITRHPFPGPGLSVRILGNKEDFDVQKLQEKVDELLLHANYSARVLPIKSVGVKGDARAYEHPVLIRGEKDWEKIEEISSLVTNNIKGINRVVFQISQCEEIKVIKAFITEERINKLREADYVVNNFLKERGLYDKVWQFPVVLLPIRSDKGEALVLRPVNSERAMTASFSKLPWEELEELAKRLLNIEGIGIILYDVTNKPPATIEWE